MSTKRREPAKHRGKGPSGHNLCFCGCGKEAIKPRRNWHSDKCVEDWKIRNQPAYAREMVWKRDLGVCAICRCNTDINKTLKRHGQLNAAPDGRMPPTTWQADHIVPVCRGGGQCGLENLQTLCSPCHKEETSRLARERANERKTK